MPNSLAYHTLPNCLLHPILGADGIPLVQEKANSAGYYTLKQNFNTKFLDFVKSGGAEGTRTPDLNTASVALSQLSYSP